MLQRSFAVSAAACDCLTELDLLHANRIECRGAGQVVGDLGLSGRPTPATSTVKARSRVRALLVRRQDADALKSHPVVKVGGRGLGESDYPSIVLRDLRKEGVFAACPTHTLHHSSTSFESVKVSARQQARRAWNREVCKGQGIHFCHLRTSTPRLGLSWLGCMHGAPCNTKHPPQADSKLRTVITV